MNRAIANTACHAINAAVPETAERPHRTDRRRHPRLCHDRHHLYGLWLLYMIAFRS
jgi:hypothetical protein